MAESLINDVFFREVPAAVGARRAVVFVHGYTGDADSTWRAEGAKESFRELLASDPAFSDHHVLAFQYKSKGLRPPSIQNIADQLLFALDTTDYQQILFIAHSMGGLVAMEAILRALEKGKAARVAGLLLYGVPMNGVEWANYAQSALGVAGLVYPHLNVFKWVFAGNRQFTALAKDSEFIEDLTGRWARRALNGGDPEIATEQRASFPVRVVTGNDDWVVRESSARGLYGEIDWINVDQEHRSLVKPKDRSAMTYLIAQQFLKESKAWVSPTLLLKLRGQMDRIWNMRKLEVISDWAFDLEFDNSPAKGASLPSARKEIGLGLDGFSLFQVVRCEYTRRLPGPDLSFGFALGHLAAESVWNDRFAFLHRTNFSALSPELTNQLENEVREVLAGQHPEEAWAKLFEDVQIHVCDPESGRQYRLDPGLITIGNESLIRQYILPGPAQYLSGREARIQVSFYGIMPSASCDYTTVFPWLSNGFTFNVSVRDQPRYLLYSSGMRGTATIQANRQHETKLQCSSGDLILPGSTLLFEWGF